MTVTDIEFMPVDFSELSIDDYEDVIVALEIMGKSARLVRDTYPDRNVWPLWVLNAAEQD